MSVTGSRPLLISDCDEVLLHMVVPFGEWLEESQPVSFRLVGNDFGKAIRDKVTGEPVEPMARSASRLPSCCGSTPAFRHDA